MSGPAIARPRLLPIVRQEHAGRCPRLVWRAEGDVQAMTAIEAITLGEALIAAGRKRLEWQALDSEHVEPDPGAAP